MARQRQTYRQAGVDLAAAEALPRRIRAAVQRTFGPRVVGTVGGFAGLFRLDYDEQLFHRNYRNPVLVASTDGVGTKLLVAIKAGRLETIGQDLVAMSVNDVATLGAEPLFFLDYLAVGRLELERIEPLIRGIAEACYQAECALIGGETAEMPGLYRSGHFDMAGFAVGVAERDRIIDGSNIRPGDVAIGLASSGLHANGYSLVRRLVFDVARLKLNQHIEPLGCTLAEELLRPTRIYSRSVVAVLRRYKVKRVVRGMAHITGGGLPGNLRRILPPGCALTIRSNAWDPPPIFAFLQGLGVDREEMFDVFNMGIGFVLIVRPFYAQAVMDHFKRLGEVPYLIGQVKRGPQTVEIR